MKLINLIFGDLFLNKFKNVSKMNLLVNSHFIEFPVIFTIPRDKMRTAFEKIKTVIESCVILQQIKPCNRLLTNYKVMYHTTDEDGSVIMLSDVLKQKEVELTNKFTL